MNYGALEGKSLSVKEANQRKEARKACNLQHILGLLDVTTIFLLQPIMIYDWLAGR